MLSVVKSRVMGKRDRMKGLNGVSWGKLSKACSFRAPVSSLYPQDNDASFPLSLRRATSFLCLPLLKFLQFKILSMLGHRFWGKSILNFVMLIHRKISGTDARKFNISCQRLSWLH